MGYYVWCPGAGRENEKKAAVAEIKTRAAGDKADMKVNKEARKADKMAGDEEAMKADRKAGIKGEGKLLKD